MEWIYDLVTNPFLVTSLTGWGIAQILKVFIHAFIYKKFDIMRLFGDGGMPSGHSATVSSLACLCALVYGAGSFEFGISIIFAIIVCHDAMGVRRETGKQALVINEIIKAMDVIFTDEVADVKLKEMVGHTPFQVGAGIILGVMNAFLMYHLLF